MIKNLVKKVLPKKSIEAYKKHTKFRKNRHDLKKGYDYDYERFLKYSDLVYPDTSVKLIGNIIKDYHAIEKGLTMPELRMGFGQPKIISLIEMCLEYISKYDFENEQLKHSIEVIFEYKDFHDNKGYKLNSETQQSIEKLRKEVKNNNVSKQIKISKHDYFKYSNESFSLFSKSRYSVRNYTNEELKVERIENALSLAQKAPSACNRQCWRTYVYTEKETINNILEEQGGNRGFGNLTNKLIVITSELGVFNRAYERNQAFIDGGIYAMNLLYALHHDGIGACILNCSTWPEKDIRLRNLTRVKDSEVFIAMIACGEVPDEFRICYSKRNSINSINTLITN